MNMKEYIDEAEAALLHTYNRYQIVWDKGDGMYLYDIEGKKYTCDFCGRYCSVLRSDTITKPTMMR